MLMFAEQSFSQDGKIEKEVFCMRVCMHVWMMLMLMGGLIGCGDEDSGAAGENGGDGATTGSTATSGGSETSAGSLAGVCSLVTRLGQGGACSASCELGECVDRGGYSYCATPCEADAECAEVAGASCQLGEDLTCIEAWIDACAQVCPDEGECGITEPFLCDGGMLASREACVVAGLGWCQRDPNIDMTGCASAIRSGGELDAGWRGSCLIALAGVDPSPCP